MIGRAVNFALAHRFLVLLASILLLAWGAVAFHALPVEAYPRPGEQLCEHHYSMAQAAAGKWNSRSPFPLKS